MLETARLVLRPFEPRDRDAFVAINQDALVMRYFPSLCSAEMTDQMLAGWAKKQAKFGYGFSAAERKSDGMLIGMAGLSCLEADAPFAPCTEIGWRLTPSVWGQGYATEAAMAWLAHGFNALKLNEIFSYTAIGNVPSQRVMQRIAMTRAKALDFDHPKLAETSPLNPMVVYRIGGLP